MKKIIALGLMLAALQGCSLREPMPAEQDSQTPTLTPRASTYYDLINMPRPKGRLMAVVYGFRDQTGQYKPTPASSFSTSVTQGAASMLMDALQASGWFVVLEREGLQNLLTERKIIRASQKKPNTPVNIQAELPPLQAANMMLEGGIIAYDTNVRSGGEGARYLGIDIARDPQCRSIQVHRIQETARGRGGLHHQRTGAVVRVVGDRGGGGAYAGAGDRAAFVAGGGG